VARKILGYIELYWTCPSCGSENLGSHAYCTSCGSPQPKSIEFHQSGKQQLLADVEKIKRAKTGADIHCGFCGTRNPATTSACSQCGADLKAGSKRAVGKIVGAFSEGAIQPIKCANCGTMNAGTRLKCGNCGASLSHGAPAKTEKPGIATQPVNRNILIIGGIGLLLLCAAIYFLFLRTSEVSGVVAGVTWRRSVAIEDSKWGLVSARGADLRCVAVTNTYSEQELRADAELVVPGLHALTIAALDALCAD